MDSCGNRDRILNVSHVFDLKAYFQFVKTPKNHYFYKHFYQKEADNRSLVMGKSRASFRKSSYSPMRPDVLLEATEEELMMARKIDKMTDDEKAAESKKIDKLKKERINEILKRFKQEENFAYNLKKIRDKIKMNHKELYLGKTFVSFKSLDLCVSYLRMFQSDLQKEVLANANDPKFNYLLKIKTRIAPFIDDLRWEHMSSPRHYYVVETMFVILVSGVNMYLEKWYNQNNLNEMIVNKSSLADPSWLLPLVGLLLMQVMLSVVSVVCLEKLISRYTFYKRSKKIEINFIFFNIFLILNNIMVVFYGFLWAAYDIRDKITEDKKYYYNFYINFQWIKNSLIIIFIPLLQRILGDYLIKWHLIPWLTFWCKKKKVAEKPVPFAPSDILEKKENSQLDGALNESEEQKEPEEELEDIDSEEESEYSQNQPDERPESPSNTQQKPKKKKPVHDFGLNSSYLIQVSFFTGFYLSFTSPALLIITFLGVWLNFKFENRLINTVYEKTKFVSISNLFISLRWAFVSFCIGIVISVANSKFYLFIIRSNPNDLIQLSKVAGFQNMIGYCNFAISCIFFVQMKTGKIMFRVLNSIKSLKSKYGGSFFKEEFERNNFKSQNPFYTL